MASVASKALAEQSLKWVAKGDAIPILWDLFLNKADVTTVEISAWCVRALRAEAPKELQPLPPSYWKPAWHEKKQKIPLVRVLPHTGTGNAACITYSERSLANVGWVAYQQVAGNDERKVTIVQALLKGAFKERLRSLGSRSSDFGTLVDLEKTWDHGFPDKNPSLLKAICFLTLEWVRVLGKNGVKRTGGRFILQCGLKAVRYGVIISKANYKERDKDIATAQSVKDVQNTTFLGGDAGKQEYTFGGVTSNTCDILRRLLNGEQVTEEEKAAVTGPDQYNGAHYFTDAYVRTLMQTKQTENTRARDLSIAVKSLAAGGNTLDYLNKRRDFSLCASAVELYGAILYEQTVADIHEFIYNSSQQRRLARQQEICKQRVDGQLVHLLDKHLPQALDDAVEDGRYSLPSNLQTPPLTAKRRRVRARKEARKKGRKKAKPKPRRVRVSMDTISGKGQRNVSGFAYVGHLERLGRRIHAHKDLRERLIVRKVDGFRTSLQADPVRALFLGADGRVDRENPRDLPPNWKGQFPNSFNVRYDPLLDTLINRDNGVPVALAIIDIAAQCGLPRPHIFARASPGGGQRGTSWK